MAQKAACTRRTAGLGVKRLDNKHKKKANGAVTPPTRLLSADKASFRDIVLHYTGIPPPPPPPAARPSTPHPPLRRLLACSPITSLSHQAASDSLAPHDFLHAQLLHNSHSYTSSTPRTPLSISHTSNGAINPLPFLSHDLANLLHSSQQATGDTTLHNTLQFLQALKQALLHMASLHSLSLNLKMEKHEPQGKESYDMSPNTLNDGTDGVCLKPSPQSPLSHTIPHCTNTCIGGSCLDYPITESLQGLQQDIELESHILTLDDLFTS